MFKKGDGVPERADAPRPMPRCVLVVVTVGQRTADNQEQDLRSLMQDPDPTHVTHIFDPTEMPSKNQ